jgi:hypothetical protein
VSRNRAIERFMHRYPMNIKSIEMDSKSTRQKSPVFLVAVYNYKGIRIAGQCLINPFNSLVFYTTLSCYMIDLCKDNQSRE